MKQNKPSKKRIVILLVSTLILFFIVCQMAFSGLSHFFEDKQILWSQENFYNQDGFKAYQDDNVETAIGIDVSDHQKKIDWEKVKGTGIDFVFVRIGYRGAQEGILHEDSQLENNLSGVRKQKLDLGVYFFSSAISKEEIDEEVSFILERIQGYTLKYPIVFDMEHYEQGGRIDELSQQEKTDLAIYFCEKIKAAGYTPMIYGNTTWLNSDIDMAQLPKGTKIWYAGYQDKPDVSIPFDIWQYSASGTLDGIETNVDMNISLEVK